MGNLFKVNNEDTDVIQFIFILKKYIYVYIYKIYKIKLQNTTKILLRILKKKINTLRETIPLI